MKHRVTALAALAFLTACGEAPTAPMATPDVAPAFNHVPGSPSAPNVSEDFNSGVWNPALEDHDNAFTLYNGQIQRTSFAPYEEARSYVRTVASGYNNSDFTAELLIQVGPRPTLIFFGLGAGEPVAPYNEPTGAFFRIHSPSWIGGRVDAAVTGGSFVEGFTYVQSTGSHKVRIIKSGSQLTFEFDHGADGSVEGSATAAMPGTFDQTNSRI